MIDNLPRTYRQKVGASVFYGYKQTFEVQGVFLVLDNV